MRNTVTFRYPAPRAVVSDEDGVLPVEGAGWFVALLGNVPGLELDAKPVQEDWGVAILARRGGRSFWLGLSAMGEHEWVVHVHHGSFAWLQRLSSGGRAARAALVAELHRVLGEANASAVEWFDERDAALRSPAASPGGRE